MAKKNMPKLPVVTGKKLIKILKKCGYVIDYIHGSHHILINTKGKRVTIPVHGNKEIPTGTLLGILSDCDISKKAFVLRIKNQIN